MELMTENEIAVKFEEILNEMNLTEEKKKPLRIMSIDMKKNMLEMHWKSEQVNQSRSKFVHPADYINYLINSNETSNYSKLCSCMESLRIALTNNPVSWVQDFGDNNGLNAIVMILNKCYSTNNHHRFKLQHECIKCLKPFMNNTAGLKRAFNDKDAFTLLARSINPQLPHIMIDAVKLMAVVCLIPPIGLNKVLEAITRSAQLIQGDAYDRFTPIIEGLKITDNEPLRASCMQLINAILANIDDLDFRLHIRNEMMRTGLCDILESLPSESEFSISTVSSELMIQMKVFNEHKDEDLDELTSRYDAIRFDLDDITDCFQLIHNSIKNSPSEPYLLSILQHLLLIRDDPYAKPAYYRLIEECVSQIILNKNGCDPDFRHGKKIQIDVDYVIDHIVERSKAEEEKNNTELCQKLEESLTAKQESEAKVLQLQTKVQEYERQLNEIKIKISNNSNATANNLNNDSNNNSNIPFGSSNNIPRTLGQGKAITATGAIPPPPPPPPTLTNVAQANLSQDIFTQIPYDYNYSHSLKSNNLNEMYKNDHSSDKVQPIQAVISTRTAEPTDTFQTLPVGNSIHYENYIDQSNQAPHENFEPADMELGNSDEEDVAIRPKTQGVLKIIDTSSDQDQYLHDNKINSIHENDGERYSSSLTNNIQLSSPLSSQILPPSMRVLNKPQSSRQLSPSEDRHSSHRWRAPSRGLTSQHSSLNINQYNQNQARQWKGPPQRVAHRGSFSRRF